MQKQLITIYKKLTYVLITLTALYNRQEINIKNVKIVSILIATKNLLTETLPISTHKQQP